MHWQHSACRLTREFCGEAQRLSDILTYARCATGIRTNYLKVKRGECAADMRSRPTEMHRRLRALGTVSREITPEVLPERDFANLVMTRIQAGVLRDIRIATPLAAAGRMGIGGFEANLLIAMAQHRFKGTMQPTYTDAHPTYTKAHRWPLFVAAVAVQIAILGGFYWLVS